MTAITPHGRPTETDARALERVVARDEAALAELYDHHGRVAFSLAYRVVGDAKTAEEVVQEVFLSVWRRSGTYRPERGSVRGWLLASVRNRAIDALRARQACPRTTTCDGLPLAAPDDQPRRVVAAALGIPLGTVKIRLRLALERLRMRLGEV